MKTTRIASASKQPESLVAMQTPPRLLALVHQAILRQPHVIAPPTNPW